MAPDIVVFILFYLILFYEDVLIVGQTELNKE